MNLSLNLSPKRRGTWNTEIKRGFGELGLISEEVLKSVVYNR
jgi:hypothetical protein